MVVDKHATIDIESKITCELNCSQGPIWAILLPNSVAKSSKGTLTPSARLSFALFPSRTHKSYWNVQLVNWLESCQAHGSWSQSMPLNFKLCADTNWTYTCNSGKHPSWTLCWLMPMKQVHTWAGLRPFVPMPYPLFGCCWHSLAL